LSIKTSIGCMSDNGCVDTRSHGDGYLKSFQLTSRRRAICGAARKQYFQNSTNRLVRRSERRPRVLSDGRPYFACFVLNDEMTLSAVLSLSLKLNPSSELTEGSGTYHGNWEKYFFNLSLLNENPRTA